MDSIFPAPYATSPGPGTMPPRRRRTGPPERTVAITYGTYDLFHIGHVRLFERIKQRFGTLIVAVSTDAFNAVKGKRSVVPFADRLAMVQSCRHVDLAIAENDWSQKAGDIVRYGCDAFVMGSDWEGRFDQLQALCEVIYLPRTEGVSSTELKQAVKAVPAA
jgi:glycerol-3-phosphate cytidylyltransferase